MQDYVAGVRQHKRIAVRRSSFSERLHLEGRGRISVCSHGQRFLAHAISWPERPKARDCIHLPSPLLHLCPSKLTAGDLFGYFSVGLIDVGLKIVCSRAPLAAAADLKASKFTGSKEGSYRCIADVKFLRSLLHGEKAWQLRGFFVHGYIVSAPWPANAWPRRNDAISISAISVPGGRLRAVS